MRLNLQLHHDGRWHDAAEIELSDPEAGTRGASRLAYADRYFYDVGSIPFSDGAPLVDARAVSVRCTVDLVDRRYPGWPPFLLDLMPQGHARRKLSEHLGLNPDTYGTETRLLLHAAGAPVGNLRIKEAAEGERERIRDAPRRGVALEEILARSESFLEIADRFALVASGSSGLQGEWPKIAMTMARDGLWYPDSVVDDGEALDHVIVKLLKSSDETDRLILAGEAAYAGVAREVGVHVHDLPRYRDGVLVIPRFDREIRNDRVVRLGQESLVSAIGVAAFGHIEAHETYLAAIRAVSSDPLADVIEYVKRDVLNLAMGNPDNHGRNSALSKNAGGIVRLAPLFDFAPMRLAPSDMGRSTKWHCMRATGRDHAPDWRTVCEAAAGGDLDPSSIMTALAEMENRIRALPETACRHGVPEKVVELAIGGRPALIAETLAALSGGDQPG